jgi:hypothetical protein
MAYLELQLAMIRKIFGFYTSKQDGFTDKFTLNSFFFLHFANFSTFFNVGQRNVFINTEVKETVREG